MKIYFRFILLAALFFTAGKAQTAPLLTLTLKDTETAALQNSAQLAAAELDWHASQRRSDAAGAGLWPSLNLEGRWSWVKEVPSLSLFPGKPPLKFGDNQNYSYGFTSYWTVWDWAATFNSAESAREAARSKEQQYKATLRQVLLTTRMTYFQVQGDLEQVRLLSNSLKLAQSQYKDVDLRYQAGSASKIDELSSHQEVLNWQRQLRQARADLANSLRELFALTGQDPKEDLSLPFDPRLSQNMPGNIEAPTVLVQMDESNDSAKALEPGTRNQPDDSLPQVQLYQALADSLRKLSWSADAGFLPKVQLQLKATKDYPNGPILETIQQNTVAVSASMPLWDWGRAGNQSADARDQSLAYEKRRDQAKSDLGRDWFKAQDQFSGLMDQQKLNSQYVSEAQELAKLVYQSYQSGRSSFLDVQSANLREMQAKVQSVRTEIQILMQMALMSAISAQN